MFDRKKMKSFAKMQLKGRWTVPVLMTLITVIVSFLFSIPDLIVFPFADYFNAIINGDISLMQTIMTKYQEDVSAYSSLSFISTLVGFILTLACLKVFTKMTVSPEPVSFSDYLQGFNSWLQAILTGIWITLWLILWSMLVIPFVLIGSIIITIQATPDILNGMTETALDASLSPSIMILTTVITIAALVIICIKSLAYSMTFCIVAEHKDISIRKTLNISKLITKGYKWQLFVLDLSFIGWGLLSVITLGIAGLWVRPYRTMTKINVYHSILKEAFDNNKVHPEDFE